MAFQYSKQSEDRLKTCDERLQKVFREVLKTMDHSILEGHRNESDQMKAYFLGRSQLKWPHGKHNRIPSMAVDAVPFPVNFEDLNRICYFAGFVMATALWLGISIRWGGDWNRNYQLNDEAFRDFVHFELVER